MIFSEFIITNLGLTIEVVWQNGKGTDRNLLGSYRNSERKWKGQD